MNIYMITIVVIPQICADMCDYYVLLIYITGISKYSLFYSDHVKVPVIYLTSTLIALVIQCHVGWYF